MSFNKGFCIDSRRDNNISSPVFDLFNGSRYSDLLSHECIADNRHVRSCVEVSVYYREPPRSNSPIAHCTAGRRRSKSPHPIIFYSHINSLQGARRLSIKLFYRNIETYVVYISITLICIYIYICNVNIN